MYVIIIGGGKVGFFLARNLLSEGHEVLVMEKDPAKCQEIIEEYGSVCVNGDGCETSVLTEVGTGRADMFIAVTDEDEDNLVACQLAKCKFKVPMTIARINNPRNEGIFKQLGIDVTVSTTNIILEHIEQVVPTHPLVHLFSMRNGAELIEVRAKAESSVVGKRIKDIRLPPESHILILLSEGGSPAPAYPDLLIKGGEQIIAMTKPQYEEEFRSIFSK